MRPIKLKTKKTNPAQSAKALTGSKWLKKLLKVAALPKGGAVRVEAAELQKVRK